MRRELVWRTADRRLKEATTLLQADDAKAAFHRILKENTGEMAALIAQNRSKIQEIQQLTELCEEHREISVATNQQCTQLQAEVDRLTAINYGLQIDLNNLTAADTTHRGNNQWFQTRVNYLENECPTYVTNISNLQTSVNYLMGQNNTLLSQKQLLDASEAGLQGEKAILQAEVGTLTSDKASLQRDKWSLQSDKRNLRNIIAKLGTDEEALAAEKDSLKV